MLRLLRQLPRLLGFHLHIMTRYKRRTSSGDALAETPRTPRGLYITLPQYSYLPWQRLKIKQGRQEGQHPTLHLEQEELCLEIGNACWDVSTPQIATRNLKLILDYRMSFSSRAILFLPSQEQDTDRNDVSIA